MQSKYKEEYCKQLIDFMSQGYSFYAFAGEIDVHPDTLYEWVKRHPEFEKAKAIATGKCLKFWEKHGINLLTGFSRGSSGVWMFYMTRRFPHIYGENASDESKPVKAIEVKYSQVIEPPPERKKDE